MGHVISRIMHMTCIHAYTVRLFLIQMCKNICKMKRSTLMTLIFLFSKYATITFKKREHKYHFLVL